MALNLYHNLVLGGQDAHLGELCPPLHPSRIGRASTCGSACPSLDLLQAYAKECLR